MAHWHGNLSALICGVQRLSDFTEKAQMWMTSVSIMVVVGIVAIDVFMRTVISYPLMWAQEVAMWAFIWATFMGGAAAIRSESHFSMDLYSSKLKGLSRIALRLFYLLACLVFAWIVLTEGKTFALLGLKRLSRPSGFPLVYLYSCIPLSGLSMLLYAIEKLLVLFFKSEKGEGGSLLQND